jgi:predicted membrane protein
MFNIEEQYQVYLKQVGLEESKMIDVQRKQLRETFFGAFGIVSIILQDQDIKTTDLSNDLRKQVTKFFMTNHRIN